MPNHPTAPRWQIDTWLNTETPLDLDRLRGKVIALHAFQMLCPGCVSHGLPQASRMAQVFAGSDLVVVGLHTVFEHHAAMNAEALRAFVHEYQWRFPIGIDQAAPDSPVPKTMRAYELRGTPSLVLIDRAGHIRVNHFGRLEDMQAGALIAQLLAEAPTLDLDLESRAAPQRIGGCEDGQCALP